MERLAIERWLTWVSYEPALGNVNWDGWQFIRWLVSGGESGPKARPSHPDWHRSARDWCATNHVAYFFKQWGAWAPLPFAESLHYRGSAIDAEGNAPPISALDKLRAGDTSILAGRVHMSFCGRKIAGRLLDGREWSEYPR
jgi:protein gp37